VAEAGSWRYAFIYELFDRWFPALPSQAGFLSLKEARSNLTSIYLRSIGAAEVGEIKKIFRWTIPQVTETLARLEASGTILDLGQGLWATTDLLEDIRKA
jgi:uncharacterized protein YcaQ